MAARKHRLAEMTFVELAERAALAPVVLLPFGSQEEQGPHAPMGDFMLTDRLAGLAAEAADAIAAPTVPFGYADFFRAVPGGIQLRADTFTALLEDVVQNFLDHGLERLVIFNGHTSNAPLIDQTVRRLRRTHGLLIPSINVWQTIPPDLWAQLHGERAVRVRGHGGEPLTSVYLHLFPELVRMDLVRPSAPRTALGLPTAGVGAVRFEDGLVQVPLQCTEVDANGMLGGDAMAGDAAIGAAIVAHITAFTARFCRHFRSCDPRDPAVAPVPSP